MSSLRYAEGGQAVCFTKPLEGLLRPLRKLSVLGMTRVTGAETFLKHSDLVIAIAPKA
jgi:hypothetical protein